MMARSAAIPVKSSYKWLSLIVSLLLWGNAPFVLGSSSRHPSSLRQYYVRNNRFASRSRSVADLTSTLPLMSSREKISNNHGKEMRSLRGGGGEISGQAKTTHTAEAASSSSLARGNEQEDDPNAHTNALLAVESMLKAITDNATGVTFQPKLGDGLYLIGAGALTKTFVKLYAVAIYGSPSVLNTISSFQPGEEQRREAALALRSAARTFATFDSFSPTTSLVLQMVYKADAKTVAKAIADSVRLRYGGSLSDIKELETLICKGIMKNGGQATKGTVLRFDCSEDGVSVSVNGILQGLTRSKGMIASAFVDVYLDEKAVSPTLVDSCLDSWRGNIELSSSLLTQHTNAMKVAGRPRGDPRLRLKADPSSIPLNSLLSNQYLSVPNTDKGKTLLFQDSLACWK